MALLETNKARTLSDIRDDLNQKNVYTRLISQEREQSGQVIEFAKRWKRAKADGEDTDALWNDYLRLVRKQDQERGKLHLQLQIRDVAVSQAMTEHDIQALHSELDPEIAVLSYFVSEERIGIFLLTHTGIQYIPTDLLYDEYSQLIDQLRIAMSNPNTQFYREPSQVLYTKLFLPVKRKLNTEVKQIIYSPDDKLFYIPMAVLHDRKQYLIEQYAITRIPSLRFFVPEKHLAPLTLQHGISCVDPAIKGSRLPFQQDTNEVLERLFKHNLVSLVGKECSLQKLEKSVHALPRQGFLHVGAHGTFYEVDPMESGIALSSNNPDESSEFWNARAMANLNLNHIELITLSSCETGLKDHDRLRDVFGIMRGLFFGGARQVMAPLWSVHDRPTARLLQAFYKNLAVTGQASSSLQKAQQTLIHHSKFHHPFYWSGFVLTGGPT